LRLARLRALEMQLQPVRPGCKRLMARQRARLTSQGCHVQALGIARRQISGDAKLERLGRDADANLVLGQRQVDVRHGWFVGCEASYE
jgi:hypothetical protein